jgi:15-cis-phytoene desaturase
MRVAVIGGGLAGLSAAHELSARGFEVSVWEKQDVPGGKARSVRIPGTATGGRKPLPGEHGFRFFPHFYRHLPDTMKRIPFPGNRHGVFDNLVPAPRGLYARRDGPDVEVDTGIPRTPSDLKLMVHNWLGGGMGLTGEEYMHFAGCMWQILTSCQARRIGEYERVVWSDFVDAGRYSQTYADWFGAGMTKTLLAASGDFASARTVGETLVQLLLGSFTPGAFDDRLLNGPTNEVWIDPWLAHLTDRGVKYHAGVPVTALRCDGGEVTGVSVEGGYSTDDIDADAYVLSVPVEAAAALMTPQLLAADSGLAGIPQLAGHVQWMNGIQFYLTTDVPLVRGHVVLVASPWGLTAVSQQQFWPGYPLSGCGDGTVKGVLSVDISAWDVPGVIPGAGLGKTARECTRDEIQAEVWGQLKQWLDRDQDAALRDDGIVHGAALDADVVLPGGGRRGHNAEPLLVNDANTWTLRPTAYTRIPNLYLAADYVQTYTDLATMEGANEAARRATNALLRATRSTLPPCRIWNLHEPWALLPWRAEDALRWRRGLPWRTRRVQPLARALAATGRALGNLPGGDAGPRHGQGET